MTPNRGKFVAYYRVSTGRQGKSGLGIEAQREAVKTYLNGGDWQIVDEFTEVETGKSSDRPALENALAAARLHRASLVVSKVDRLTRSVVFLSRLLEAGVEVRFADLPQIEGATGRFLLQQMVAVAEPRSRNDQRQDEGGAGGSEKARQEVGRQSWYEAEREDARGLQGGPK
jgi:DNA invertase Pin-like site-specific DNA recombinase